MGLLIERSVLILVLCITFCNVNSDLYCPMTEFKTLRLMNEAATDWLHKTAKSIVKHISITFPDSRYVKHFKLSGSARDGTFTSRLFFPNTLFKDQVNRMVDLDFEMRIMELKNQCQHCVIDDKHKPGFAKVKMESESINCSLKNSLTNSFERLFLNNSEIFDEFNIVKTNILKERFMDVMDFEASISYIQAAFSLVTDIPLYEMQNCKSLQEITKATYAQTHYFFENDDLKGIVSFDIAFVIAVNWTPQVTQRWAKRQRNWPPAQLLASEISRGFVILKPSVQNKANMETTEMRYSFAHLETKIFSLLSETQLLNFYVFKSIIYKWLKPIDPEKITSYIGKTVMLWIIQDHPPSHEIWDNDPTTIIKTLKLLLTKLLESLKTGLLPYYFVPEINVLENIPPEAVLKMIAVVEDIVSDVTSFLPKNTKDVYKGIDWMYGVCYGFYQYSDDLFQWINVTAE